MCQSSYHIATQPTGACKPCSGSVFVDRLHHTNSLVKYPRSHNSPPLPPSLAVHSHHVASHASCTPDQWPRWRKGVGTVMRERAMNAQLDGGWISDTWSRLTDERTARQRLKHQEHNNTHICPHTP